MESYKITGTKSLKTKPIYQPNYVDKGVLVDEKLRNNYSLEEANKLAFSAASRLSISIMAANANCE